MDRIEAEFGFSYFSPLYISLNSRTWGWLICHCLHYSSSILQMKHLLCSSLSLIACQLLLCPTIGYFACSLFKAKNAGSILWEGTAKIYHNGPRNSLLIPSRQNSKLFSSFAFKKGITSGPPSKSLCSSYYVLKYEYDLITAFRVLYLIYPHGHFLYKKSLFFSFSNQLSQDGEAVTVGPMGSRWRLGWNFWWRWSRSETDTSSRWVRKSCDKSAVPVSKASTASLICTIH